MTIAQLWNNFIAYALQIGLLVGLGALAPPLLRLRGPRAKLLFWQALLVACILLPWVQPWRQEVVSVSSLNALTAIQQVASSAAIAAAATPAHTAVIPNAIPHAVPFTAIILWLVAAGIVVRLAWLGIGLARLAGYRKRGHELASDPVFKIATAIGARWLVSDEIASPVTFGWRDPVVLLPARFPSLPNELREAILCHELIHVERRDWICTLAEETARAVFWFHPAIWWVLGEIQFAREQTVDRAVIEITHARGQYVDALLAMAVAGPGNQLDLVPAPLFLRKRHLKRRVIELLQEVRMTPFSKVRFVLAQAAGIAAIAAGCWLVSGAFPLTAAPQLVADAAGVVVNVGDARLLHRTPVAYPAEALAMGVQGRVAVEASIDADGGLSEETVVRCPRELCAAAVDSLQNWQFDASQANTTRAFTIDFERPAGTLTFAASEPEAVYPASQLRITPKPMAPIPLFAQAITRVAPGLMASATVAQAPQPVVAQAPQRVVAQAPQPVVAQAPQPVAAHTPTFVSRTAWLNGWYVQLLPATITSARGNPVTGIRIAGLSDSASSQLQAQLPVHTGDVWSQEIAAAVAQTVAGFDPHLEVDLIDNPRLKQWSLWIGPAAPSAGQPVLLSPSLPAGVYAPMPGDGIRPPAVLSKVDPEYSESAKNAGISGTVTLSVVVGADGKPQNIQVIGSLEPSLDQSAIAALARWCFRPGTTQDGVPVSVQAQVNVSFRVL